MLIRHLMLTGMIVGLGEATDNDFKDMMSYGEIKIGKKSSIPIPYAKLPMGLASITEGGAALGGLSNLGKGAGALLTGHTPAAMRSFQQGLKPFAARYPMKVIDELNRKRGPRASAFLGVNKKGK
jgi:hypothetical protein